MEPIQTGAFDERPLPRIWTVFLTVTLAFVAMIGMSIVGAIPYIIAAIIVASQSGASPIDQGNIVQSLTTPSAIFLQAALGQSGILGVLLFALYLSPEKLKLRVGLVSSKLSFLEWLAVGVGSFLPASIGMVLAVLVALVIPPDTSIARLFNDIPIVLVVPWILFIALAPGFGEEMLFRGYMQRRLLQRWNPWTAIVVTAFCFSAVHLMPHTVVFAFPVGVWFGYVAWKTGSIWPTILGHALINGVWNALNIARPKLNMSDSLYNSICLSLFVIGALAWFYSLRVIGRGSDQGQVDE